MVLYILGGFIFGLMIPYISRRFAKFMPATPAYALWQIFVGGKKIRGNRNKNLRKKYYWRSLMFGLATSFLTAMFVLKFGGANAVWCICYLWLLLLLAEIDIRMRLLPDILTVPLLIIGFAYAAFGFGWVVAAESALGALFGYFMPIIVSFFIVWKNRDAFGGGDIKFLAALGAWLGVEPLLYVILMASILMLIYALIRRCRTIPFGPGLTVAAIIVALCFF